MHRRAPWRWKLFPLVLMMIPAPAAMARRSAPDGSVTPKRGPLAGQSCRYGDGLNEYFHVAEYTANELEAFVQGKKPPPNYDVQGILRAIKERWASGVGQFSKEGYEHYKELVLACLESGKVTPEKDHCEQRAPYRIGIDIFTGKVVAEYTGTKVRGYWILEPGWVK